MLFQRSSLFVFSLFLFPVLIPTLVFAEKLNYIAPTILPHTERAMKTAGYWISRHPSPDKVIMNTPEIERFNDRIEKEFKTTKDILAISQSYSGRNLKSELEGTLNKFMQKELYLKDGRKPQVPCRKPESCSPRLFWANVKNNLNLDAIPSEISVQYGFIVHFSDQRFFPVSEGLNAEAGDIDFDELQNSDLDVGTPVVVLHKSADGQWFYVLTDLSDGWVKVENVALCGIEELKAFLSQKNFTVVIAPKADLYLDSELTQYYDYVRMGTRLPISIERVLDTVQINFPTRTEQGMLSMRVGYFKTEDAHNGYLPYTVRNVIEQAFKLLNSPYGWGGMEGEQDCSRFLHEVFSTVGINLPRNSKEQGGIGQALGQFDAHTANEEKLTVLKEKAVGGVTILPLKGHIMLYLGMVEDRPYVIHALWAYREKVAGNDRVRVINRVAVTDLYLGEGSKKGSLLERIIAVKRIE